MKRDQESLLPGGLNTYTEYNKRTIRWYEEKIASLQRSNKVLTNDLEQMSNVLRLQQEQIARHQDDIIKLQEENRVLRLEQGRPKKSAAELEESVAELRAREESLIMEMQQLDGDLQKMEASRNTLARQTGQAYEQARPRIAELERRRVAAVEELTKKNAQLRATRGQLTKSRNMLNKWTMF